MTNWSLDNDGANRESTTLPWIKQCDLRLLRRKVTRTVRSKSSQINCENLDAEGCEWSNQEP